jgi:hypothetical protein
MLHRILGIINKPALKLHRIELAMQLEGRPGLLV